MSTSTVYKMSLRSEQPGAQFANDFVNLPEGDWSPSPVNPAYMERPISDIDDSPESILAFVRASHQAIEEQVRLGELPADWHEHARNDVFRIGPADQPRIFDFNGKDRTAAVVLDAADPTLLRFREMSDERRCAAVDRLGELSAVLDAELSPAQSMVDIVDHQTIDDMADTLQALEWTYHRPCFAASIQTDVFQHSELLHRISSIKTPRTESINGAALARLVTPRCASMPLDNPDVFVDRAEAVASECGLAYCTRDELKAAVDDVFMRGIDGVVGDNVYAADVEDVLTQAMHAQPDPYALVVSLPNELSRADLEVAPSADEHAFASALVERFQRTVVLTNSVYSPSRFRAYTQGPNGSVETQPCRRDTFGAVKARAVPISPQLLYHPQTEAEYDRDNPADPSRATEDAYRKRWDMAVANGDFDYFRRFADAHQTGVTRSPPEERRRSLPVRKALTALPPYSDFAKTLRARTAAAWVRSAVAEQKSVRSVAIPRNRDNAAGR